MPIAFTRYVDIVSAVGGVAQAAARELILRLMTSNVLVPTETVVEFETIDEVGDYFGTTAEEFLEAQFYFSFISKLATSPGKISFTRFTDVAVAPTVFGGEQTFTVADFDTISDGSLTITLGPDTELVTFDFAAGPVLSLAEVATEMQTQIQAANVAAVWTGATVTFNATDSRFELLGGATGDLAMDIEAGTSGTDIQSIVGWVAPPARFSNGIDGTTLTEFLALQAQISNNFGSFSFIPTLDNDDITEVATWNDGENVKYMYLQKVTAANAQAIVTLVELLGGTALTLSDVTLTTDFPWLFPGAIMAATPYTRRAAVQNYMFQQHSLTALVSDTTLSSFYDGIQVNYYGETQQAGDLLAFYQRGFLQGIAIDPIDMGVYSNEVFFKDAAGVALINLFLAVSAVPANASGIGQILATLQAPIDLALFNGTISVGKDLNQTQIAFVTAITGDELAYFQVQDLGYWITAQIIEPTSNEFVVEYTLIYSKNDVVRAVEGSHLLI